MTELERFEKIWNGFASFHGQRGEKTRENWENILFSVWKHHPDWNDQRGFQIKCRGRTIYKVIDLAEEAGLLIKVGNYSVGRFTRQFKKNHALFDYAFRDSLNKYGTWLNKVDFSNLSQIDAVHHHLMRACRKHYIQSDPYHLNLILSKSRKHKKLNYDLVKLHQNYDAMSKVYWEHRETLNQNACHPDFLLYDSWLKFKDSLPTGRPYSPFCSTLNRNKKHKVVDPSMEYRDDFLRKVGLPDYYEVYDIKSQIPRVNYLFHTGEWKDDDYDFYKEIIEDYFLRNPDPDGDKISRGKAGSKYYNDSMKQLFMRIYFGKGSEKQSFKGYKDEYMKRNKEEWENIIKVFPKFKKDDFYPVTFDEWYEICCSTEKICGASIGALVFWFTFFIETEIRIELLKRGKKVYNVYDGFYFNQDISAEISEILKEKAKYVYDHYMINIKL